jgi:hypothetical protein
MNKNLKTEYRHAIKTIALFLFCTSCLGEDFQNNATQTHVVDLDRDGHMEIVVVDSENPGARVAWMKAPADPRQLWTIYDITPRTVDLGALHSLVVADINNDGNPDIITVEMEWMKGDKPPRWWAFLNTGNGQFESKVILDANLGGHEAEVGDVDGDGDLDVCAKLWRPQKDNGNGGSNHFSYLENLSK